MAETSEAPVVETDTKTEKKPRGRKKRAVSYKNAAMMMRLVKDVVYGEYESYKWSSEFEQLKEFLYSDEFRHSPIAKITEKELKLISTSAFHLAGTAERVDSDTPDADQINATLDEIETLVSEVKDGHPFYERLREKLMLIPEAQWVKLQTSARKKKSRAMSRRQQFELPREVVYELNRIKATIGDDLTAAECIQQLIKEHKIEKHRQAVIKEMKSTLGVELFPLFMMQGTTGEYGTYLDALMMTKDEDTLWAISRAAAQFSYRR